MPTRILGTLIVVLCTIHCAPYSIAEIETHTLRTIEWKSCGVNCLYFEFPFSVDPTLASASVDSVWTELWGTSHMGFQVICLGSDCTTVYCWDGLLVSFESTSVGSSCVPDYFYPDGEVDYVAGAYVPKGDNIPFFVTLPLRGIEGVGCCDITYETIDPYPSFAGVFTQGQAELRIQRVHGGPMGASGGCYKCNAGLAEIDSVSVNIAFTPEVATEINAWGSMKALYR